jgi:hypothetical protein
MLGDQRSRYVGRFARGWPRLPGDRPPGNHRPGRGPTSRIGGGCMARKRAPRPRTARAAVTTCTLRAPAPTSVSAHAATVAPVVSTSSTSSTRRGTRGPRATNAPRIAIRRSSRRRRACGPVDTGRTRSLETGSPSRRPRGTASARAWSYPRSDRRRRPSGTQVTTSTGGSSSQAAIAPASAPATSRQPVNFRRCTACRAGPTYRKGARALATGGGGQSRQDGTATDVGQPHRAHHGGVTAISSARHGSQNGQAPEPHPAHRLGKTTSSARPTIARG